MATNIILTNYSKSVGQNPVQIIPPGLRGLSYLRIANVSPVNGPTLWYSRYLGSSVAANLAGAIALAPGQYEEFKGTDSIPLNPVWAVAPNGTVALTAEAG